jgi:hypothetical protein
MPEVQEQEQVEQDFFGENEEVVEETEQVEEEQPELGADPEPEPPAPNDDLIRQNQELQRRLVDFMESQKPRPQAPTGPDLGAVAARYFDQKTAGNLKELFNSPEFMDHLRAHFAGKDDLNRLGGTLAHYARNADEARVFEEFRQQGIADTDIKEARKLVDRMVNDEGAYFPNAQVAMDAAYGRLRRQRAKKTAGATTAARAQKTAGREAADMGAGRGGAGVPVLTDQEKTAAYNMDTEDFLAWLDKKQGK